MATKLHHKLLFLFNFFLFVFGLSTSRSDYVFNPNVVQEPSTGEGLEYDSVPRPDIPVEVKGSSEALAEHEIKDTWKKQVMVQAPAIFQGMETFFKRVFNNSLDEEQRYQEFMTRVVQATNKVKGSIAKVALDDAKLHNDLEKLKHEHESKDLELAILIPPKPLGSLEAAYYDVEN